MVEQSSGAIVGIVNYQKEVIAFAQQDGECQERTGSGVIYKIEGDNAYIVTNNHVIEGAEN